MHNFTQRNVSRGNIFKIADIKSTLVRGECKYFQSIFKLEYLNFCKICFNSVKSFLGFNR